MPSKNFDTIGTQQGLGTKPVSSPSSNPRSGQFEPIGTEASLGRKPIASPSANPKSGAFQTIGEQSPLNRAPHKVWNSNDRIPFSERAVAQSQISGKGKRK